MNVRFFDRQARSSPLNGRVVKHDGELLELLDGLRDRPPFFAELVGENALTLLIGLGGATGTVQCSRSDGEPPYLMALGPNAESSGEYLEFLIGDTLTPVPRRYCVAFELVKEIAVYFQQTGDLSPAVSWEGV